MFPQNGDVGDERQVKIDRARGQVDADGDDIPDQGRAQVGVFDDVESSIGSSEIE